MRQLQHQQWICMICFRYSHLPQADTHGHGAPDVGDSVLMTLYTLGVLSIHMLGDLEHAGDRPFYGVVGGKDAEDVVGRDTCARPRRVREKGPVSEMTEYEDVDVPLMRGVGASDWKERKRKVREGRHHMQQSREHEHSTRTTSWHTTATARVPRSILTFC